MHPSMRPEIQERRAREHEEARSSADIDRLQKQWAAEDRAILEAESWQGKRVQQQASEIAALAKRVAKIERRTDLDKGALIAAVGDVIGQIRKELRQEIAAVEAKQLRFCGVHEAGRTYQPGNLVVRNGGLWHCNTVTTEKPGGSSAWQLCVKQGEASKGVTVA